MKVQHYVSVSVGKLIGKIVLYQFTVYPSFHPINCIIKYNITLCNLCRWKEWEQIQALELDFTLAESQWSEVSVPGAW